MAAVAAACLALVAAGLLGVALVERGHLAVGTRIGGVDVGERSPGEARALLGPRARRRIASAIRVVGGGPERRTSGVEVAARPLIDAAIRDVSSVGTFGRILRHVGLGKPPSVPISYETEKRLVEDLAARLDADAAVPPRDATVSFVAGRPQVSAGIPGLAVDREAFARRLRRLPGTVTVPLAEVAPRVSTGDATAAARAAEELLSSPRTVALGAARRTLPVDVLRRLVRFVAADGGLALTIDDLGLRRALRPLRRLEQPGRDASFRIVGRRARLVPARSGRRLDSAAIARSLARNRRSTVHRARFVDVEPRLTTEAAAGLGIRELVSEFTTPYPCCAPRVVNIQRAAEILDGTIIGPGETFSLNERLGKRTPERGFVPAPQIYAGRLEDAVGGGVSQVATTFYNAAFFAGLRLDEHTPHQFYISRYPMGREATVSWGGPELIFTNDWQAAILVKVAATDTSITVRFYSTNLDRRVETTTGEPFDYVAPVTRVVANPGLAPGQRVVVQQAGPSGFTVEYTRKVFRGSRLKRDERYRVRYEAENAFVEVGPRKPEPKRKPKTKPDSKPQSKPETAAPGDVVGDASAPADDPGGSP